jgi:hypothetical protein
MDELEDLDSVRSNAQSWHDQEPDGEGCEPAPEEPSLASADALVARPAAPPIPARSQMALALQNMKDDAPRMSELDRLMGAFVAAAEKMHATFDKIYPAAECQIRIERQLGVYLLEHVRRGGKGGSSAPLPRGIDKHKSQQLKSVARVSEDELELYLRGCQAVFEVPTWYGAMRFAARSRKRKQGKKHRPPNGHRAGSEVPGPSPGSTPDPVTVFEEDLGPVWEELGKLVSFDIAIGVSARKVNAACELDADVCLRKKVKGCVVAWIRDRIEDWLSGLQEARKQGEVVVAVVVFRAATREPWFRLLDEGGWTCCFLGGDERTPPAIVAYLGSRAKEFALMFRWVGAVFTGCGNSRE